MTSYGQAEASRPFDCYSELDGWKLYLAQLTLNEGRDLGNAMDAAVSGALGSLRDVGPEGSSETGMTRRQVRAGILATGVDAARAKPFSEELCARLIRAPTEARGPLAWQFLCALVARSAAPWSVIDRHVLSPPLVFRCGRAGERLRSEGAPFACDGMPVLADQTGAVASPWTHACADELAGCANPVVVCYLPGDLWHRVDPKRHLGRLVWVTWAYRFAFAKTIAARGGR